MASMKVVTSQQMQEIDRRTIHEFGITGIKLMEAAGNKVYDSIKTRLGSPDNKLFYIFCGKGNNGGDGFVTAWLLKKNNGCPRIFLLGGKEEVRGEARYNLELCKQSNVEILEILDEGGIPSNLSSPDLVVDAVLGTGTKGSVSGIHRKIFALINSFNKPVLSVDVPSGLDASTGKSMGACVQATWTVTMGLPKAGLLLFPGAKYAGEVIVADIGIPKQLIDDPSIMLNVVTKDTVRGQLPKREPDAHKGDFGKVFILAGSQGMTGAAALCAEACLKTGAGLVYLGIPKSLNPILEMKLTEVITKPLPETKEKTLGLDAEDAILSFLENMDALAMGPGLSTHPSTVKLVRKVLGGSKIPVVVDADGLNAIAQDVDMLLKETGCHLIITPHPGEMARLMGTDTKTVQENRLEAAQKFAREHNLIVALKGARTVIADPSGETYINLTGNPGMASGGTGDVLTGMIAGLLGQRMPPFASAVCGVYLHGLAGDLAKEQMGEMSLTASDVLRWIPKAVKSVLGH